MRLSVATLSLSFLLLAGASVSVHAQAPPPEASRPASGIAHSFVNWLHHVAGIAPHHRERSMPPRPRPRPAELAQHLTRPIRRPRRSFIRSELRNQRARCPACART